ncbi:MAG: dienelactone hydrolase family protein [Chloroflexota bacterium]|nr:dienelactone hydrolase family protein [Chloroflexota bacterium]
MSTQTVSIATGDGDLTAFVATPDEPSERGPAVLVLHELFGLNDDIRRIARRFADNGYVALAPDLYSVGPRARPLCIRRTMQALRSGAGRAFDDIEAARSWLASYEQVDEERLAVAGFCMGGGFAILHAARAAVGAVADFYGAVPRETEALEGICPVFGGYGQRDRVFVGQAQRLRGHLEQLGVEHEVTVYPGAGHSFMNRHGPVRSLLVRLSPMAAGYHEESAEAAWATMLDFFERNLGGTIEPVQP